MDASYQRAQIVTRHSGARACPRARNSPLPTLPRRRGRVGRGRWLWIPDSLASLGFRNDELRGLVSDQLGVQCDLGVEDLGNGAVLLGPTGHPGECGFVQVRHRWRAESGPSE